MSGGIAVLATALALGAGQDQNNRLIFEGTAIVAFAFASYRVWAAERAARNTAEDRVKELEREYPHALRLTTVDYNCGFEKSPHGKKITKRSMGFTLNFKNAIASPLEYEMKKILINGSGAPFGIAGEVLAPDATSQYYTASIPVDPKIPKDPEPFVLELEYNYGEPGKLTRHVEKKLQIVVLHSAKKTGFKYEINKDDPCP